MKREYPESPIVSVGAVVAKQGRILLVKRGREPGYGQWTFPGGVIELGETSREAAIREVKEECDLIVDPGEVIDVIDRIQHDQRGRVCYHFVIIDFLARHVAGEFHPSDELLDGVWVAADELPQYELTPEARRIAGQAFQMMEVGR